jgi:hypothetical protein
MKKGYDAVVDDGGVFQKDDAITTLGVGKNMVRSIRHWCLAAGLIEEDKEEGVRYSPRLRATDLGHFLFGEDGHDVYLEDPATLWILHWQITTNVSRASTWWWTFSHFHEPEFTRDSLSTAVYKWSQTLPGKKVAEVSVKRDVETFLRTYVPPRTTKGESSEDSLDCPLVELGLIYPVAESGQIFSFSRGVQEDLPDGVLLYGMLEFWEAFSPQAETLAIPDLARQPGSPGQVFKIDEASLVSRVEQIEDWSDGRISYRETAGMRQLYRRKKIEPQEALTLVYGATAGTNGGASRE